MIITYLLLSVVWFLRVIEWIIFAQIILSWTMLLGVVVRIGFIESITEPLYGFVRRYLPTTFGMMDFAPLITVFIIEMFISVCIIIDPAILFYLR